MNEEEKIVDFSCLTDAEILEAFKRVAVKNGTTARELLADFMKDYIVSSGHPEQVKNRWPWNKE